MQCIILAGGSGTRLWPLSREQHPKQFLPVGDRSLFQRTWLRARALAGKDGIWVVTNEAHRYLIRDQVEALGGSCDDAHLLAEPTGRNTLPAIAWAMAALREADGEAIAAVLPSDHLLDDAALDAIRAAAPLAADRLVTFGVTPTSPHTGYGYIRPGAPLPGGVRGRRVRREARRRDRRGLRPRRLSLELGHVLPPDDRLLRGTRPPPARDRGRRRRASPRTTPPCRRSRSTTACSNIRTGSRSPPSTPPGPTSATSPRSPRPSRPMRTATRAPLSTSTAATTSSGPRGSGSA